MRRETIAGVVAAVLTALIVAFHVQRAYEAGGFWRDEVGTVGTATAQSIDEFRNGLTHSTPPALRYIVARIWIQYAGFGSSDASLRILGAVGGLALLAGVWFTLRAFGCRFPLLSLILFAANGMVLRWGDSFRSYSFACLAILLAYVAMRRLIDGATVPTTLLALLASVVSVQFAFQNVALVAAFSVAAAVASVTDGKLRAALVALSVAVATLVSIVPYSSIAGEYQSLNALPPAAFAAKTVLARLAFTMSAGSPWILAGWLSVLLCALAVGAGSIVSAPRVPGFTSKDAMYHGIVLVVAVPAFIAFCRAAGVMVNPWHCLMVVAVLAVAAESLITVAVEDAVSTIARVAAVCILAFAVIPRTTQEIGVRQTNVDVIARYVAQAAGKDDFVVVNPWFFGLPFTWYYRGTAPWTTLPPMPPSLVHRYDRLIRKTTESEPNATLYASIERALRAGHDVWMVGSIEMPSSGASVPQTPTGAQKWYSGDYVHAWSLQLGAWLQSHGVTVVPVDVHLDRAVSMYENAALYKISGWAP